MKYHLLTLAAVIGFSSIPVIAMENSKITISKDKLTPTSAISQVVPIMKYEGNDDIIAPIANHQVYNQKMDSLVPTMALETTKKLPNYALNN